MSAIVSGESLWCDSFLGSCRRVLDRHFRASAACKVTMFLCKVLFLHKQFALDLRYTCTTWQGLDCCLDDPNHTGFSVVQAFGMSACSLGVLCGLTGMNLCKLRRSV